jgi:hypothetical protein
MTEAEWLGCTDPEPMLEYLRNKTSDRKLRLFAVACCRRASEMASFGVVSLAERAADGLATDDELANARSEAERGFELALGQFSYVPPPQHLHADGAAVAVTSSSAWEAAEASAAELAALVGGGEPAAQAILLRDLFGNPFRPASIDPTWLAWNAGTVVKLAQAIYDERRFGDLPILADAMEEAGCSDQDILAHCRSEEPHVRGCWVVDLLLGKE